MQEDTTLYFWVVSFLSGLLNMKKEDRLTNLEYKGIFIVMQVYLFHKTRQIHFIDDDREKKNKLVVICKCFKGGSLW